MKKSLKIPNNYNCYVCKYTTVSSKDFNKHLLTAKHKNRTNSNKKSQNVPIFICDCGKEYTVRNSMWYHKKKCSFVIDKNPLTNIESQTDDFKIDKEFVMSVMKQNYDLQNQVMELLKNGTHNTTNNNKTFNLNFFLNETCKNAMNIMDFVNSLQLQLGDLEKMGEVGYVNGMTNIIIKSLKDMDVTTRPLHCTDVKREVLYVKDEDKWDKETAKKPTIRKAIKHVAQKNARLLQEFREKYPDCNKSESKHSDTYNKLMIEAMGGKGSCEEEQEDKIIKKVAKEITIENNN